MNLLGIGCCERGECGRDECGDSGATWEVRLPAADIPGESESTWKHPNQSHEEISSYDATGRKSTIKGKNGHSRGKKRRRKRTR